MLYLHIEYNKRYGEIMNDTNMLGREYLRLKRALFDQYYSFLNDTPFIPNISHSNFIEKDQSCKIDHFKLF